MAIRYYDDALTDLIKSWTLDPNLVVLKPEESTRLFEMSMDKNLDQPLTLPLIAVSRDKNIDILQTTKQQKTFSGFTLDQNEAKTVILNVIPIKLKYQLDIYTRFFNEADEYVRNFVFQFINYPKLTITLPYNKINFQHDCKINLETTIVDNSDIKEHLFADQFSRLSLSLSLDDAYLFSSPIVNNTKFESVTLNVQDSAGVVAENQNLIGNNSSSDPYIWVDNSNRK